MDKVSIRKSKIGGKGIFAKSTIKKGEVIGIFKGVIVPDNKESYKKYGEDHLLPISYSEAMLVKNFPKYTNHACDPSAGLSEGINLVAIRNIKKDEEITIDYNTIEYDWKMNCNCGSPKCRKKVTGYKYLTKKLKNKYKGYIAPFLLTKPKKDI